MADTSVSVLGDLVLRGGPMTLDDLPDILTVREAAAYLRIGLNSAYGLTKQWRLSGGKEGLGYVPVGRGQRIPKVELIRFLAKPFRQTA